MGIGGAGLVVVILIIIIAASGGDSDLPDYVPPTVRDTPPPSTADPDKTDLPPIKPPAVLEAAQRYVRESPNDLEGQVRLYDLAIAELKGTP